METSQPRVLIVDDDPRYLELLKLMLESEGFDVNVTVDPRQVPDLVAVTQPNIVVTDVSMPGVDGFELALGLRSDPRTAKIPVLFCTARSSDVDRHEARAVGAAEYLLKPIAVEELVSRLRQIIGRIEMNEPCHE